MALFWVKGKRLVGMGSSTGTKTLLQREKDIMTGAQAASAQLAKVEEEAAARSKAV